MSGSRHWLVGLPGPKSPNQTSDAIVGVLRVVDVRIQRHANGENDRGGIAGGVLNQLIEQRDLVLHPAIERKSDETLKDATRDAVPTITALPVGVFSPPAALRKHCIECNSIKDRRVHGARQCRPVGESELQRQSIDGRHPLLVDIQIRQLRLAGQISRLDRNPDQPRIVDSLPLQIDGRPNGAIAKLKPMLAKRILPGRWSQISLGVMGWIVIHCRRVGEELPGKVDSRHLQIAHRFPSLFK